MLNEFSNALSDYLTELEQNSEQRIKQSERTISAAQQLITNTNKTIARTFAQRQIVQKPNCKIRI